jgi:hypothetical protein
VISQRLLINYNDHNLLALSVFVSSLITWNGVDLFSIRIITHRCSISRVRKLKAVGRAAALVLLLVAMMGPWFYDSHPATEESCSAPLVWLGNGHCACLVSLAAAFWVSVSPGQSSLWLMCLLPALPFLSTLFLILGRGQRYLWIFHLIAWGLAAAFSVFLFVGSWSSNSALRLWGAGFGGMLAVVMLAGEMLAARLRPDRESRRIAV